MKKIELPKRVEDSNKATCGRVSVFGGSMGMAGSVCLASTAALRIGAGIAYAVVPDDILVICQIKLTEVMVKSEDEYKVMFDLSDSLVIGPGYLSKNGISHIMKIAQRSSKPMVVDAEGLKYIKNKKIKNPNCVITPHSGEFANLLSVTCEYVNENREYLAKKYAEEHGCVVVLKGKNTVAASPEGEIYINKTGGSGLSTAGSGDVLSGMIGGLMAQGLTPFSAACTGVYIHGMAGDLAERDMSPYSLMSNDILNYIGKAIVYLGDSTNGKKQL